MTLILSRLKLRKGQQGYDVKMLILKIMMRRRGSFKKVALILCSE